MKSINIETLHHVVIVGGGAGGEAVHALRACMGGAAEHEQPSDASQQPVSQVQQTQFAGQMERVENN